MTGGVAGRVVGGVRLQKLIRLKTYRQDVGPAGSSDVRPV